MPNDKPGNLRVVLGLGVVCIMFAVAAAELLRWALEQCAAID